VTSTHGSAGTAAEWRNFEVEREDGVVTITFARPDRLNALTFEVYADLRDLFTALATDSEAGAVVLRGTGRGFCAGGDVEAIMKPMREMGPRELLAFTRMTSTVVQRMRECPVPIIASVNGIAAGAGAVLALAADFRLLARSASLAFVFTRAGLSGGDMGAAYLLPRLVGQSRATSLLLLGEKLGAEEAGAIGLAHEVVDDDELPAVTAALARRLADGPRFAHAATKELLTREADTDLATALGLDAYSQALLIQSDDHVAFQEAFAERRDPIWSGR
jgi:enoyl-CoA hydratase/carnithine racemase